MSHGTASAPSSFATLRAPSALTSTTATFAPLCANARADAAPIPLAAPVTTATFPLRSIVSPPRIGSLRVRCGDIRRHRRTRECLDVIRCSRLARFERVCILEQRAEQLCLIRRRLQRDGTVRDAGIPLRAHGFPQWRGARQVPVSRRPVETADRLVTIETEFTRHDRVVSDRFVLLIERKLHVELFLDPAGGRNRVSVRTRQHLVVATRAELAARQWPPLLAAHPCRVVAEVLPAAHAGVARRAVHLPHALHPGTMSFVFGNRDTLPRVAPAIHESIFRLERP